MAVLVEQFGARLKYWRTSRGLIQKQLEEKIGVQKNGYVSGIERGKRIPNLDTIERLLDALNVDIGTFFEEEL